MSRQNEDEHVAEQFGLSEASRFVVIVLGADLALLLAFLRLQLGLLLRHHIVARQQRQQVIAIRRRRRAGEPARLLLLRLRRQRGGWGGGGVSRGGDAALGNDVEHLDELGEDVRDLAPTRHQALQPQWQKDVHEQVRSAELRNNKHNESKPST